MFFFLRVLCLGCLLPLPLLAVPVSTTLTLVDEPGFNRLTLTLSAAGFPSTDTTTLTGSVVGDFDVDPQNHTSTMFSMRDGRFFGTDMRFRATTLFGLVTVYDVRVGDLSGTVETIAPPAPMDPASGQFDASLHELLIDQGTIQGTSQAGPIDTAFTADDPVGGPGTGTGQVTLTPLSSDAYFQYYTVTVVMPVAVDEESDELSIVGSGTIKAVGTLKVPLGDEAVWVEAGGGSYEAAGNWLPAAVPAPNTPIIIPDGTSQRTGTPWNRAADTRIDGGGLLLTDSRFRHAEDAEAHLTMNSGSISHSGDYFMVAHNRAGSITINGGSLATTVSNTAFLSDAAGSEGVLTLNGGVFNASLAGGSRFIMGRQSAANDRFIVNGGVATITGAGNNNIVEIARRAHVAVDGGELHFTNLQRLGIGWAGVSGRSPVVEVSSGALHASGFGSGGDLFVSNNAILRISGGEVNISGVDLRVGSAGGSGTAGTVVQRGGTLGISANAIVLSHQSGRAGQFFMLGGVVEAADITTGDGVRPRFYLQDGTVALVGDRRELAGEDWFISLGEIDAVYDAVADRTTITASPAEASGREFRYYRFSATHLRSGLATGAIQLSGFDFLDDGAPVDMAAVTVGNPGGNNPPSETPDRLIDGDAATKWSDLNNAPLVFDFGGPRRIDGYRFTTGDDAPERDPLQWLLEGSDDAVAWETIDVVTREDLTPDGRLITTLDLPLPAALDPAVGYAAWLAGFPGLADPAPFADPDGDGLPNILEFVLDGDPEIPNSERPPVAVPAPGGGMVFSFVRRMDSKADGLLVFQFGSDFADWSDVAIPDASAGDVVVEPDHPAAGLETVTITVDSTAGRMFGRLQVTTP